jgi:hypothetical protein
MRLKSHTFSGFGELCFVGNDFAYEDDLFVDVTLIFRVDSYKQVEKPWELIWAALCASFDEVVYIHLPGVEDDCFKVRRAIYGNARNPEKLLVRWLSEARKHYMSAFWDLPTNKDLCWMCNRSLPDDHNLADGCPYCSAPLICA